MFNPKETKHRMRQICGIMNSVTISCMVQRDPVDLRSSDKSKLHRVTNEEITQILSSPKVVMMGIQMG